MYAFGFGSSTMFCCHISIYYTISCILWIEQFSMGICGCVPLEPVQEIARSLLEQLRADEYCPYELRVSWYLEVVEVWWSLHIVYYVHVCCMHAWAIYLRVVCIFMDRGNKTDLQDEYEVWCLPTNACIDYWCKVRLSWYIYTVLFSTWYRVRAVPLLHWLGLSGPDKGYQLCTPTR